MLQKRTEESCRSLDNVLNKSRGTCEHPRKYSAFLIRIFTRMFVEIHEDFRVFLKILLYRDGVFFGRLFSNIFCLKISFIFFPSFRICSEELFYEQFRLISKQFFERTPTTYREILNSFPTSKLLLGNFRNFLLKVHMAK